MKYYESFELKILIGVEKIIIRGKVGFGFLPEKRFFVTNSSTQADKKYLFQQHSFKFDLILSRRNFHSFFLEQKSAKMKIIVLFRIFNHLKEFGCLRIIVNLSINQV